MCGFAGFVAGVAAKPSLEWQAVLQRMGDPIRHRGPDHSDQWTDADTGMGLVHRRLAILDLSAAGHQPMVSASGRWVIAFNGEIYNHADLRQSARGFGGSAGMAWAFRYRNAPGGLRGVGHRRHAAALRRYVCARAVGPDRTSATSDARSPRRKATLLRVGG